EEDGVLLCQELDRHVLTKGAWATVMFLYQDRNRQTGEYGPTKVTIRRYQKRDGVYMPRSKFNISSMDQAGKIVQALQDWIAREA
ncbi:MAG: hypothetical protein QGI83_05990, partial [Candidatus Latescibacteria bacterium]|nr:hypothetical protein [Candidatus Latescibacterota bacterium]